MNDCKYRRLDWRELAKYFPGDRHRCVNNSNYNGKRPQDLADCALCENLIDKCKYLRKENTKKI